MLRSKLSTSKSPERVKRQKPVRLPTYRIENEYNPETMPQYFQISVNILEGRKFAWANPQSANSYVTVAIGKKKYRTTMRRNIEEPIYREFFIFEMYASIREVQSTSLWLAVMEPRCFAPPHLIGEANIDLGVIWAQPNHQVYHKWAQLRLPRNTVDGPVGFLKLDLSIILKGEVRIISETAGDEKPEENILLPIGSEQQRANYVITIYGAFGLPNFSVNNSDHRYMKSPNTFVRVYFCGLMAKTAVQHRNNNPIYGEQVSIVEMFPNTSQMIRLEVCSVEGGCHSILASTNLKLDQISHDGENGFLPTFGPSLVHIYGLSSSDTLTTATDDEPFLKGSIFMSLKTIVPYYNQSVGSTNVVPVNPVRPDNLWCIENFFIFCPILEVSMLDFCITGNVCGVAITIGDFPTEKNSDEEFRKISLVLKQKKLHYTGPIDVLKCHQVYGYLGFHDEFPVLQLATTLPDFRFRIYKNNMIYGIVADLEIILKKVERRLKYYDYTSLNDLKYELNKALDDTATNIQKFLEIAQHFEPSQFENDIDETTKYLTELDVKQTKLQKEEMEKIIQQVKNRINIDKSSMSLVCSLSKSTEQCISDCTRKNLKALLTEAKLLADNIKKINFKLSDGWPDIVLWLLSSGSRVAFSKIPASDIIYSPILEQSGRNCGRIQTVYLKPLKCPKHVNTLANRCFCIAGKIELLMWMGSHGQKSYFESYLPAGYSLKMHDYEMRLETKATMLECRIFIYRAKFISCNDTSGEGIFIRINALNSLKETKMQPKSLKPIWNQVLKIQKLMNISSERLSSSPPIVLAEVFELNVMNKTNLIGRVQIVPVIENKTDYVYAPKLQWYEIFRRNEYTGQVLMSVQLLQIPDAALNSISYLREQEKIKNKEVNIETDKTEPLPDSLIPKSSIYKVDVYWWGLRDLSMTRKPCVALSIDDFFIKSDVIYDKKPNCNFPNGRITQILKAPLGRLSPPLCISLYDTSTFGRTLFLGANVTNNPSKYIVTWLPKSERESSLRTASITSSNFIKVSQITYVRKLDHYVTETDNSSNNSLSIKSSIGRCMAKQSTFRRLFSRKEPREEEYTLLPVFTKHEEVIVKNKKEPPQLDWWSRYSHSLNSCLSGDKMNSAHIVVYNSELESQSEFSKFKDWCSTVKIYGKKSEMIDKNKQLTCGYLKVGIAIYSWPPSGDTTAVNPYGVHLTKGYFDNHPNNGPTKYVVRVYVIKGINLTLKDYTGNVNPYIIVDCGRKRIGDRNAFVCKTSNPIFGKMYEFCCTLPDDYLLNVSAYDYDNLLNDELIGSTSIDLEDRIYSKHRACVGISKEYNISGPTKWRDRKKPSDILKDLCMNNHLPSPIFPDTTTVMVNGVEYKDDNPDKNYRNASERRENICLDLLHDWHTLPICGYHLVPEHVETRTLYHPDKPGIEQGNIQMWVDIFPFESDMFIPPPVDVTPRKLEEYELRVIIWSVQDVRIHDIKSASPKKASNIYVKAWIGARDLAQNTDVHYQSITGEGKFNWRMIFNFEFQPIEKKMIVREKGTFTEIEEYLPPILVVQVMDSAAIFPDDILASINLTLNSMPKGSRHSHCPLNSNDKSTIIDLFVTRTVRGWWPLKTIDKNTGIQLYAGLIDMELTLLPKQNAITMPVGIARESPCPLPKPDRRKLEMFTKPLKGTKQYIIKQSYKVASISIIGILLSFSVFTICCYYLDIFDKVAWVPMTWVMKKNNFNYS